MIRLKNVIIEMVIDLFKFSQIMSKYKNILVDREYDGKIYIVTINREEFANAINRATAEELADAFRAFDTDDQARVAILTGKGKYFCAGADLKSLSQANDVQDAPSMINRLETSGDGPLGVSRMILSKPVIAAINGHAVAGGFELALWCDMRITYKDCDMGVYCRRFGVPLIDGGTIRLPLLIGLSRAMDLILTGRTVKGEEGYTIGLINRLTQEREEVLKEAVNLARSLCDLPQTCMRNDRMSVLTNIYKLDMKKYMENEFGYGMLSLKSGEAFVGAKKFAKGEGKHGKKLNTELRPKL